MTLPKLQEGIALYSVQHILLNIRHERRLAPSAQALASDNLARRFVDKSPSAAEISSFGDSVGVSGGVAARVGSCGIGRISL